MLSAEALKRIKRIELQTRRLVNNTFAGSYHSVFRGQGLAFDTVRPYQPGDDIRDIDWNVTARTDEAFVKRYTEERELTVLLLLDTSASCLFGTQNRQKRDVAAELGAVIALAAITNNDKVGLLAFSDQIEHYTAPRKGRNHVLRLIRDLMAVRPAQRGTDIASALRAANRMLKQRAIIFLLSDFLAPGQNYLRDLQVLSRRHDVIAVILADPLERSWPNVGIARMRDLETDDVVWIDTTRAWQRQFQQQVRRFQQMRDSTLLRAQVDRIDLTQSDDYVEALARFFRQRQQRAGR